jgi:protein-disulfide isomerase
MNKLVLLTVVLAAACQSDTRNLERKLDEINRKLDNLPRGGAGAAPQRPQRPEPDPSKVYAVPVEGDPSIGPADAKITLIKAYDYACGFCERARATMDELKQKYGNDLRIVYKQLVIHPRNAMVGALAFCAAAKQGKHVEMDRLIWDKGFKGRQLDNTEMPLPPPAEQQQAAGGERAGQSVKCWDHPEGCKNVYSYAAELGLDVEKFKADLKGPCDAEVKLDGRQLAQFGLSSTPAFFINGRYIAGAQATDRFVAVIDDELKKANERIGQGTPQATYYQQWVLDKGLKSLEPRQ